MMLPNSLPSINAMFLMVALVSFLIFVEKHHFL